MTARQGRDGPAGSTRSATARPRKAGPRQEIQTDTKPARRQRAWPITIREGRPLRKGAHPEARAAKVGYIPCPRGTELLYLVKTKQMAKTLSSIQRRIERLLKEAASLKQKEAGDVIARIKQAIEHYGITQADLFGGLTKATGRRRGRPPKNPAAKKTRAAKYALKGARIAPKYRDEQGNTWAGRGNRPRWLVAALKSGRKLQDFAL